MTMSIDEGIAAGTMQGVPAENSSWKLRFWLIFIGQSLSLLGSAVTQFVLIWWITDRTADISALGIASMAALLPQAVLGPLAGVLADRYCRQKIMLLSDIISAVSMLVLIALFQSDTVELWHIYTMMAIRSAMQAFQQPAATASVAMLVPASFLTRAVGLGQSLQGVTLIGAAPLGALVMSVMPIGWALGIDVFTAVLGSVPLLLFTIPQISQALHEPAGLLDQFREGMRTVWDNSGLRQLYALMAAAVFVIMPLFTLVPMLVKVHFGGGASQVALLESLAGIGMIIGGGVISAVAPVRKVPWILGGFLGSCLFIALASSVPGDFFWLACVFWMIASVSNILANGSLMALMQSSVPNHLQGRVISLLTTLLGLAAPLGLIVATPLGERIGARWLFVILGCLGAIVVALGFMSSSIRGMDQTSDQ